MRLRDYESMPLAELFRQAVIGSAKRRREPAA